MQKVGLFYKKQGFSLVELLIMIAVITTLATILFMAYNAWTKQALNAVRHDEVKAWDKHFKLYKATYRKYPDMPAGYYCLGTGFPDIDSDGTQDCRDLFPSIPTLEHPSTTLNTELAKVGKLPKGSRTPSYNTLGPFVDYYSSHGYIVVLQIFDGDKCPSDMKVEYNYNDENDGTNAIMCYYVTAP